MWWDLDGNGVQDVCEGGIGGVTLELLDLSSTVVATAVTGGDDPSYLFSGLFDGTYTVRVVASTLPAGLVPTYDVDGVATAGQATFALGPSRTDVDFGYRSSGAEGVGTEGYWENHPESWPVPSLAVGGVVYTVSEAIALMQNPTAGDKTYDMFQQLTAAKLNVLAGNDSSCICSTIALADAWLVAHPVGSGVDATSPEWVVAGPWQAELLDYNLGNLCAPHRG